MTSYQRLNYVQIFIKFGLNLFENIIKQFDVFLTLHHSIDFFKLPT